MSNSRSVHDSSLISLDTYNSQSGILTVIQEETYLPWTPIRFFFINCEGGAIRGKHAHKTCHQGIFLLQGEIEVALQDGTSMEVFDLFPHQLLVIPSGLWVTITSKTKSIFGVVASERYDESDYIKDYKKYLEWKRT